MVVQKVNREVSCRAAALTYCSTQTCAQELAASRPRAHAGQRGVRVTEMERRINRIKAGLLCATLLLLAISFYLAHLSGLAMNDAVGDTFESLDLSALSALVGSSAMVLGVSLIVAEQSGGVLLRTIKLVATISMWMFLQVSVCVLIQTFSAP